MHSSFDLRPDGKPFIEWLSCTRTRVDRVECESLSRIESMQTRMCVTLLHGGALYYDQTNSPHLFNSTRYLNDSYSQFDAKDVMKIVLNFEPEDYADLKRQIGARVVFHDNTYVASQRDLDFFVTRGFRYDFIVHRRDVRLLDEPYGNCKIYKNNLKMYKDKIRPRVPLNALSCLHNCVIRNLIHHANCWPPTVPYFHNDTFDPGRNLTACQWYKGSYHMSIFNELLRVKKYRDSLNDKNNATGVYNGEDVDLPTDPKLREEEKRDRRKQRDLNRLYRRVRRFCWTQCTMSCVLTDYSVNVIKSIWPTDMDILFDDIGTKRRMRHCCALITVKYPTFHHRVHEFQPKYKLEDAVGNLGGLLAAWLSVSIVSLFKVLRRLADYSNNYLKQHGRMALKSKC